MNPHLKNLDDDFLYHLGYSKSDDLQALFGDVKVSLWFNNVPATVLVCYGVSRIFSLH